MSEPHLLSLQIGLPRVHETSDGPWHTAYFKEPVQGPVWLGTEGLDGDGVGNTKHHGGPENAVCAYPGDHIDEWRAELSLPIGPGAFGENFTVAGLTEETVCIGDVFEVGETLVQISKPREPCATIARRWQVPDLVQRVRRTRRTGWYLRVLREGHVEAGLPFRLAERPHPEWSVARAFTTWCREGKPGDPKALAECESLSPKWRMRLQQRTL